MAELLAPFAAYYANYPSYHSVDRLATAVLGVPDTLDEAVVSDRVLDTQREEKRMAWRRQFDALLEAWDPDIAPFARYNPSREAHSAKPIPIVDFPKPVKGNTTLSAVPVIDRFLNPSLELRATGNTERLIAAIDSVRVYTHMPRSKDPELKRHHQMTHAHRWKLADLVLQEVIDVANQTS